MSLITISLIVKNQTKFEKGLQIVKKKIVLKKKNCILAKVAKKIFFKIFVVTVNSTATGGEGWVSILITAKRAGDL